MAIQRSFRVDKNIRTDLLKFIENSQNTSNKKYRQELSGDANSTRNNPRN